MGALVGTSPTNPHDTVTPEELAFALSQLVERAHTHGIKVYLGTIMPDKGLGFYYTEAGEALRQAVNLWIRSNKVSDGVIDFDKAVRDPADPQRSFRPSMAVTISIPVTRAIRPWPTPST